MGGKMRAVAHSQIHHALCRILLVFCTLSVALFLYSSLNQLSPQSTARVRRGPNFNDQSQPSHWDRIEKTKEESAALPEDEPKEHVIPEDKPKVPAAISQDKPKVPAAVPDDKPKVPAAIPKDKPKIPAAIPEDKPKVPAAILDDKPKVPEVIPEDKPIMPEEIAEPKPETPADPAEKVPKLPEGEVKQPDTKPPAALSAKNGLEPLAPATLDESLIQTACQHLPKEPRFQERCGFLKWTLKKLLNTTKPDDQLKHDLDLLNLAQEVQNLQFFVYSVQKLEKDYKAKLFENSEQRSLRQAAAALKKLAMDSSPAKTQRIGMIQKTKKDILDMAEGLKDPSFSSQTIVCSHEFINEQSGFTYGLGTTIWCLAGALAAKQNLVMPNPKGLMLDPKLVLPVGSNFGQEPDFEYMKPGPPKRWPQPVSKKAKFTVINKQVSQYVKVWENVLKSPYRMFPQIPQHFDPKGELFTRLIGYEAPSWYAGEVTKYLLRPTEYVMRELRSRAKTMGISLGSKSDPHRNFTAGVHIRRGNKIQAKESAFYDVGRYMMVVEEMYRQYEVRLGRHLPRRLFVASDDPSVIGELKERFPHYTILANQTVAEQAQGKSTGQGRKEDVYEDTPDQYYNYDNDGLINIFLDMLLLGQVDFALLTQTSNVGKLVYAYRVALAEDPSEGRSSTLNMDMPYHNERDVMPITFKATQDHQAPGDLHFKAGDTLRLCRRIDVASHDWFIERFEKRWPDGVVYGITTSSQGEESTGPFPFFKVKPVIDKLIS